MLYLSQDYNGAGALGFVGELLGSGLFLCNASPSGFINTSIPATISMMPTSSGFGITTYGYSINDSGFDQSAEYMWYFVDQSQNRIVTTQSYSYPQTGSGTTTIYVPSGVPSGIIYVPSGTTPSGIQYIPSGILIVSSGITIVPSGYPVPSGIEYINNGMNYNNQDSTNHNYAGPQKPYRGLSSTGGVNPFLPIKYPGT